MDERRGVFSDIADNGKKKSYRFLNKEQKVEVMKIAADMATSKMMDGGTLLYDAVDNTIDIYWRLRNEIESHYPLKKKD